jgi:hypothetical protein
MSGITLKNGLISYYGNPAGYTDKEKAIVDSIFQNDELTIWLQSRSLTPKWTDGVMERLLAGERADGMEGVLLKNVRIWQLKPDVDVHMKFIPYEEMVRRFGEPSLENYNIVYDGQLDTNDLEATRPAITDTLFPCLMWWSCMTPKAANITTATVLDSRKSASGAQSRPKQWK